MENYEKKYKNALEWARQVMNGETGFIRKEVEEVFPELKESEDERIRKALIDFFNKGAENGAQTNGIYDKDIIFWLEKQGEAKAHGIWFNAKDIIAPSERDIIGWYKKDGKLEPEPKIVWFCSEEETRKEAEGNNDCFLAYWAELPEQNFEKCYWFEKQGEKKSDDNVEPKFKVGDWIVSKTSNLVYHVDSILLPQSKCYYLSHDGGVVIVSFTDEQNYHLWTIQDAKDGDVLYSLDSNQPFIYKERKQNEQATAYCGLNIYGKFFVWGTKDCVITFDNYVPATKEQRDLLFAKMKEAGYTFDFEKKELKKIVVPIFNIGDIIVKKT